MAKGKEAPPKKGAAPPPPPADDMGIKMDRCLTDLLIKSAGGFFIGSVFSVLFFKRKTFPIMLGTGFGTGVAYRNCEQDLNH